MVPSAPSALIDAPFSRRSIIARLERLLERYASIRDWHDGDAADRRGVGRRLLLEHPTGLREAQQIDAEEADARHLAVRRELERARAAAPLPPGDPGGRALFALADLEPLMIELRRQRRGTPLRPAALEPSWDPAWPALEPALAALAQRPASEHLGTLASWLTQRYGVPGWWNRFWGEPEAEVDVGAAADFALDAPTRVAGPNGPLLVVRRADRWLAASAECPHRGGDLTDGELDGDAVICPVHGWAFSLHDGATPADPRCRLPLYLAREVEGRVLVRARAC